MTKKEIIEQAKELLSEDPNLVAERNRQREKLIRKWTDFLKIAENQKLEANIIASKPTVILKPPYIESNLKDEKI
jgi:hypothetical protein